MTGMTLVRSSLALGLCALAAARAGRASAAGPGTQPATRPAVITLHVGDGPARKVVEELSKRAGAVLPLTPPDLFDQNPLPPVTLDVDHKPFWTALEEVSRKTGLEPMASPDDPYPR